MHANVQLGAAEAGPLVATSALEEALAACLETCAQLALVADNASRAEHLRRAAAVLRAPIGYDPGRRAQPGMVVRDARQTVSQGYPEFTRLTAREREVLHLLAKGWSNQQIADELVITVRTAECHVQHILTKLCLRSRMDVVTRFHELRVMPAAAARD
ncbi:MAG: hypothetical protein NVSMB2_04240 [Chloroflexota bacterium]